MTVASPPPSSAHTSGIQDVAHDTRWEWRLTLIVLLIAALRTAIFLVAAWPHTTDDAYITLRYSRHLAEGVGLLWNAGEAPVEGYSNFLFVLLGAAAMRAGMDDPMPVLKALGGMALVASALLTFVIGRRWLGPAAATVPVLLLTGYSGTVLWAVSGLETSVYQFLVLLTVFLVLRAKDRRDTSHRRSLLSAAGFTGFLLSLTRPEGPVIVLVLLLYVALGFGGEGRKPSIASLTWIKLPFLVPYLAYTVWRVLFFERLLPNSVACKAGHTAAPFALISDFLSFAWIYIALAFVALLFERTARHPLLWSLPIVYLLILYNVDPIMSHHNRHFLTALPFVLIMATMGLQRLVGFSRSLRTSRTGRGLVAVVVLIGGIVSFSAVSGDIEDTALRGQPPEAPRLALANYLKNQLGPEDVYVIGDSGLVPFVAEGRAIDAYCLNCRQATSPEIDRSPGRLADWILDQEPRFIIIQSFQAEQLTPVWSADIALASHPSLTSRYTRARSFGDTEDVFHYFLYERVLDPPVDST